MSRQQRYKASLHYQYRIAYFSVGVGSGVQESQASAATTIGPLSQVVSFRTSIVCLRSKLIPYTLPRVAHGFSPTFVGIASPTLMSTTSKAVGSCRRRHEIDAVRAPTGSSSAMGFGACWRHVRPTRRRPHLLGAEQGTSAVLHLQLPGCCAPRPQSSAVETGD